MNKKKKTKSVAVLGRGGCRGFNSQPAWLVGGGGWLVMVYFGHGRDRGACAGQPSDSFLLPTNYIPTGDINERTRTRHNYSLPSRDRYADWSGPVQDSAKLMAPSPSAEAEFVKDKARKDLLGLLEGVSTTPYPDDAR